MSIINSCNVLLVLGISNTKGMKSITCLARSCKLGIQKFFEKLNKINRPFCVIEIREFPPFGFLRVHDLCGDVASVIMVASNHVPVLLQRRVTVDVFIRCEKSEVVDVPYSSVVEVVSGAHEEVDVWNLEK